MKTTPSERPRDREVPGYQITFYEGRKRPCSMIIPVINEGERIQKLLEQCSRTGIAALVDIVLVDGGSTDQSLEEPQLKKWGVRGLLLKTGPGKLSSQLRCGYAFSLDQGYDGVVTIDGNNKDDPEAVPAFVRALEEGYDFVQASRFLPGGEEINTPPSRHWAIRLIHAPLLSLFSGFSWTDTTQGFRAYSRRMLADDAVAPFRDIFQEYELLAYLSYRVPKLGYRCVELPTRRIYPPGKIPTKISPFKGNWKVFTTLLRACLGRYNP